MAIKKLYELAGKALELFSEEDKTDSIYKNLSRKNES